MNRIGRSGLALSVTLGLGLCSSMAMAQGTAGASGQVGGSTTIGGGAPAGQLPPPQSFNDPKPQPAAPTLPAGGVTEQAGVGGTQAYGRAGVLELGGSAGFQAASSYTAFNISPSVGWFFIDNLQLSALLQFQWSQVGSGSAKQSQTQLMALIEPSYHLPFTPTLFGFLGLGVGLGYTDGGSTKNVTVSEGAASTTTSVSSGGAGFALQPRLGLNILIGRSGILTPDLRFAYNTTSVTTASGLVLGGVSTAFGANIGYTVMW